MKEQVIKTLYEILKANPDMTYNEATKVQEDIRLRNEKSAAVIKKAGACVTAGMKRDRDATGKMKNKTQEDLQTRVKEVENSLSIALEINESHQRYNGKLQARVTELEEDNKKLAHQVEDLKMNHVRKAGL